MRRVTAIAIALLLAALTQAGAQAGPQALEPPTDDHGTFLNILPAGQGQSTTTEDTVRFGLTGEVPAHDMDQYEMYSSLRLADGLTNGDLSKYYKSETFLPPTGDDIERTETPEPGLSILRDKFGVPHVYGDTRAAAMFGAGYVTGEDRLFLTDVLRHVGRGHLSEFLGPSDSNLAMDAASYQVAGYSETELQAQVDRLHQFGADGDQVIEDGQNFVDGINARIDEDMNDPSLMPAEYPALQIQPEHFQPTDLVAIALLIQATFAGGGGGELQNALFLQKAQDKLGKAKGYQLWRDLREAEDPNAPVTADGDFPYMTSRNSDPKAVAMPKPDSVEPYVLLTTSSGSSASPSAPYNGQSPIQTLRDGLTHLGLMVPNGASNWLAVTGNHTASGHPIAVMGPQVGYWDPEILMEIDIHAPELDARGATFPGLSLYVLLGRGPDFAWSATSGISDLIDVRAEELCDPDGGEVTTASTHYMFEGKCQEMYTRTDQWFAKPSAGGTGPPTQVTADVHRTVHGPVFATGMVGTKPVAFTIERSTFGGELDSAVSFIDLNSDRVDDPATFQKAMSKLTGSFNWLYVDDKHVAYYHSGLYPIRAQGVDPDLPSWGTGQWEWNGFVSPSHHPQAVDPKKGWIDSWNNKPAHKWRAADSYWTYGPVHRVQMLARQLRTRIPQGHVTRADMVQIMANASTIDLRGHQDLPAILRTIGQEPKELHKYVRLLRVWLQDGTHRIDRDADGSYENEPAVALMDTWWPLLIHKMFDSQLDGLYDSSPLAFDDKPAAGGSAYIEGWYGYVQKALRMALGRQPVQPYQVLRCADGTLAGCRTAVLASLKEAVKALGDDSSLWDVDEGADAIKYSEVGVLGLPDMPWQNRPTFQQVVEVTSHR